ncbi:MAG: hypothetical protein GY711_21865 [bacterium]|nr:hypothetical protein [bacterium]
MVPDEREDVPAEVLQRELEIGLAHALPGVEIVDRDLGLGTIAADLVGVDPQGRLVLVLIPEDPGDASVLTAIDAMSQARGTLALLARHLEEPRLALDLAPQIVLVGERFEPRTIERLSVFDELELRLLEVREVRSARSVSTFFVDPGAGAAGAPPKLEARGVENFLVGLDEDQRAGTELLVRRLERVGEGVQLVAAGERLEWRFRGAPLCSVAPVGDELQANFPRGAPRPLVEAEDFETFVEGAIERYFDLLDGPPQDEDLQDVEIVPPADTGPILTPEEIEAFRE